MTPSKKTEIEKIRSKLRSPIKRLWGHYFTDKEGSPDYDKAIAEILEIIQPLLSSAKKEGARAVLEELLKKLRSQSFWILEVKEFENWLEAKLKSLSEKEETTNE